MTSHVIGKLLHAQVNRVLGLSTLQAEFEQTGRLYTRSKVVAMQTFGLEDEDWQRCLGVYHSLETGHYYIITGDTLAASDGTVLLLGTLSIRPMPPQPVRAAHLMTPRDHGRLAA